MKRMGYGSLRRDFKLILWSRSVIGRRCRTRYLIGWEHYQVSISLETLPSMSKHCIKLAVEFNLILELIYVDFHCWCSTWFFFECIYFMPLTIMSFRYLLYRLYITLQLDNCDQTNSLADPDLQTCLSNPNHIWNFPQILRFLQKRKLSWDIFSWIHPLPMQMIF